MCTRSPSVKVVPAWRLVACLHQHTRNGANSTQATTRGRGQRSTAPACMRPSKGGGKPQLTHCRTTPRNTAQYCNQQCTNRGRKTRRKVQASRKQAKQTTAETRAKRTPLLRLLLAALHPAPPPPPAAPAAVAPATALWVPNKVPAPDPPTWQCWPRCTTPSKRECDTRVASTSCGHQQHA